MFASLFQITVFNTVIQPQYAQQHTFKSVYQVCMAILEGESGVKYLILMEASTGIEPVYTDLQSGASLCNYVIIL
ncbi:hypothetical protein MGEO_15230 [Marivita geojedonensis]|uniref:Uncharacterized protein n=1 Tax=Marivita geojedonensis TaxID=1123756 RepID=A0A1X4NI11_9RHOB|nr:hypothetical protein MGEO_15230 [Marivita geojedonensis]